MYTVKKIGELFLIYGEILYRTDRVHEKMRGKAEK
jgi:hypothetical protein